MTLHNCSRWYCQKRIAELSRSANDRRKSVYYCFFSLLLIEIECFTETDFEDTSHSEILTYLGLMSEAAKEKLREEFRVWFEDLIRQGVSFAAIEAIIAEACQDFLLFLENYSLSKHDEPTLPYRRVLSYTEYQQIWEKFGLLWLTPAAKSRVNLYLSNRFPVKAIASQLQEIGVKRLFRLGLATNYEIDLTLMDAMFSYDNSYWTPKTLDWYIWAEGHGYCHVAGRDIEKIIQKCSIDSNKAIDFGF